MKTIILKHQREKSLLRHHPWVFSGAIAKINGDPQSGDTVDVIASDGRFLGRGSYSPHSQIVVRIWTFDEHEPVMPDFFRSRIERAIQFRKSLPINGEITGYRVIHAESDGLPGVIVDRYSDYLVCQFLTAGADFWKETIISLLHELIPCNGIYERSDVDVREKEQLEKKAGVIYGEPPPDSVEITEGKNRFLVDIKNGQKTGFYLDQRDNRFAIEDYSDGKEILNCFSYTDAFAVHSLNAGAVHVTNIDASATAIELAALNIQLNNFDADRIEHLEADVFVQLRKYRDSRRQFDIIVLDPPKFIDSKSQLNRGSRGYKDINLLALKLLRPGGLLMTFSCSGLMSRDLFQKIVSDAALDAGREAVILKWLTQSADHPTSLNFPEATYLKGLLCQVSC